MPSTLTKAQLDELRGRLEDERARILSTLGRAAPGAPERDQEVEIEEAAQRQTERARGLEVEARQRALLADVERALAKLASGGYGTSERTGEPIPYARLRAVPWAREAVDE